MLSPLLLNLLSVYMSYCVRSENVAIGRLQVDAFLVLLLLEKYVGQEIDRVEMTAVHLHRSLQVRLRLPTNKHDD